MKNVKHVSLYFIVLTSIIGLLLSACESWELPTRKSQRTCVKPAGNLDAQIQQRKVDFAITGSSGTIDRVQWEFGNGSTTITTGMTASYTYPTSGTYTTKATLTNTCNVETTLLRTISANDAVAPSVSLQPASDISINGAIVGMTVTSTGNATINRYGICYSSTNSTPELGKGDVMISDKMESVPINTAISFNLNNLQPNSLYYVRSFAVNSSAKVGYSNPIQSFRTGSKPAVSLNGNPVLGVTTASVSFIVTSVGSPAAVEYGICYSATNSLPEVGNSTVIPVATPAVGTVTSVSLTNLTPNKTYYYRSYAKLASGEIIYSSTSSSFTTQVDTLAKDLIASVSFTDQSLQDISGFSNNIVLVDNPTFIADRKGRSNSAILLDGRNDYFYMRENTTLRPAALSISIWIKPSSVSRLMQIFNKSNFTNASAEMYSSLIRPNPAGAGVTINTDIKQQSNCVRGQGWQTFTFSSNPDLNAWHHVVLSYSGRSAKMYFDSGLLYTIDNLPAEVLDICPGGDLKFGAQSIDIPNYFSGAMDDIRIYGRALTMEEVKTLFNQ